MGSASLSLCLFAQYDLQVLFICTFFFFFFSLPLAEGVFCEGDSSVLPPVCSWSQQRDQYVVDAPWPLEGLRRAEGRWAAGQSSLCSSSPCVCPSSFSHFRDRVESWQVGQVGPGLASPPQWEISCIQSGCLRENSSLCCGGGGGIVELASKEKIVCMRTTERWRNGGHPHPREGWCAGGSCDQRACNM